MHLHFAIAADGLLVFALEHHHAGAADGFFALAIDLQAAVVFNVLLHVALGMQVDFFLALAVFKAQFVVAATARRAATAQSALGFIGRQFERRRGQARHQAA